MTPEADDPLSARPAPDDRLDDERVLAGFGYVGELKRALSPLAIFGIAVSFMSITVSVYASHGVGLAALGPAFVWTWPVVPLGPVFVGPFRPRLADGRLRYRPSGGPGLALTGAAPRGGCDLVLLCHLRSRRRLGGAGRPAWARRAPAAARRLTGPGS